jgi:hypothetical protein
MTLQSIIRHTIILHEAPEYTALPEQSLHQDYKSLESIDSSNYQAAKSKPGPKEHRQSLLGQHTKSSLSPDSKSIGAPYIDISQPQPAASISAPHHHLHPRVYPLNLTLHPGRNPLLRLLHHRLILHPSPAQQRKLDLNPLQPLQPPPLHIR